MRWRWTVRGALWSLRCGNACNGATASPWQRAIRIGIIIETFETAVRWDLMPSFYQGVTDSVMDEIERQGCQGYVTCRLTHCYAGGLRASTPR